MKVKKNTFWFLQRLCQPIPGALKETNLALMMLNRAGAHNTSAPYKSHELAH